MTMTKTRVAEGLYMRTAESGASHYFTRFKVNGKSYERGLGSTEAITLREAKLLAAKIKLEFQEREETKEGTCKTFGEIYEWAINDVGKMAAWRREKTKRQMFRRVELYILPHLKDKPLDKITRDDVLKVLEPIWYEKTKTASAVRNDIEKILERAIAHGLMRGMNVAIWKGNLSIFLPAAHKVSPVTHREAPTLDEIRDLVELLRENPSRVNAAILFGLSTPMRSHEYCEAKRIEIQGDTWIIPKERRKTDATESFKVPLNSLALEALAMVDGDNPHGWFFPTAEKDSGGHVCFAQFPNKLSALLGRRVTMHGVRSTFRDWASEEDVRHDVAEKSLMHQVGSDTERSYHRTTLLKKRRAVAQAWADAIAPRR